MVTVSIENYQFVPMMASVHVQPLAADMPRALRPSWSPTMMAETSHWNGNSSAAPKSSTPAFARSKCRGIAPKDATWFVPSLSVSPSTMPYRVAAARVVVFDEPKCQPDTPGDRPPVPRDGAPLGGRLEAGGAELGPTGPELIAAAHRYERRAGLATRTARFDRPAQPRHVSMDHPLGGAWWTVAPHRAELVGAQCCCGREMLAQFHQPLGLPPLRRFVSSTSERG